MQGFKPPSPNVKGLPAADIHVSRKDANDRSLSLSQTFPVYQSEADQNEFLVPVRASVLASCRNKLSKVAKGKAPWHELLLALCTLALGATLGAIPADIKPGTRNYFLYFTVFPVVAVGSGMAYFFLRRESIKEPAEIATDILNHLPEPKKTSAQEGQK